MNKIIWLLACAPLLLAGCEEYDGGTNKPTGQFLTELPEGVRAMAAPYQDLTAVRLDPARNCYVYRYAGPVETTFLPLRTRDGRPICVQTVPAAQAAPAAKPAQPAPAA